MRRRSSIPEVEAFIAILEGAADGLRRVVDLFQPPPPAFRRAPGPPPRPTMEQAAAKAVRAAYRTLGVEPFGQDARLDAAAAARHQEATKRRYLLLMRKYHPDKHPGGSAAHAQKAARINAAYDALKAAGLAK